MDALARPPSDPRLTLDPVAATLKKAGAKAQAGETTRRHLLDVAEKLFAETGYHGVTIRDIAEKARVNVATAHYHFGSKEALFVAVFERSATRLATELDDALSDILAGGRCTLADIIRAFLTAGLSPKHFGNSISRFLRLRAWAAAEDSRFARDLLSRYFDETMRNYQTALGHLLPDLTVADLAWRFHVLIATLVFTANHGGRASAMSGGEADPEDIDRALDELVPFLVAGFTQSRRTGERA